MYCGFSETPGSGFPAISPHSWGGAIISPLSILRHHPPSLVIGSCPALCVQLLKRWRWLSGWCLCNKQFPSIHTLIIQPHDIKTNSRSHSPTCFLIFKYFLQKNTLQSSTLFEDPILATKDSTFFLRKHKKPAMNGKLKIRLYKSLFGTLISRLKTVPRSAHFFLASK